MNGRTYGWNSLLPPLTMTPHLSRLKRMVHLVKGTIEGRFGFDFGASDSMLTLRNFDLSPDNVP
ncbi:hypothetical protein KBY92_11440 [Synechococcus sp. Cruz CV-v-12]|nr:hypothetical protein [Synechococcus sp. Cruz CV-v-12]